MIFKFKVVLFLHPDFKTEIVEKDSICEIDAINMILNENLLKNTFVSQVINITNYINNIKQKHDINQ